MIKSLHFTEAELSCRCGCGGCDMDPQFIALLEALRVSYSKPMKVNSAFRCEKWNQKVGGAPDSQHLLGRAIDIQVVDPVQRFRLVALAQSLGFKGIGIDKQFLHLDSRDEAPTLWVYPVNKSPLRVVS